jgi:hypothetical protein
VVLLDAVVLELVVLVLVLEVGGVTAAGPSRNTCQVPPNVRTPSPWASLEPRSSKNV